MLAHTPGIIGEGSSVQKTGKLSFTGSHLTLTTYGADRIALTVLKKLNVGVLTNLPKVAQLPRAELG